MDTEAEIDACVKSIGGIKVSDLFQGAPSFNNADYLFKDYNIVAELKCLSKDMALDIALQNKIELIVRKHLAESKIMVFGTRPITSGQLPQDCSKEIAEIYRKPIRDVMRKANKQIRETKFELHVESAHGLLILVNDNNTAIDPDLIEWIIGETFRRDSFRSIESVLYVTLNLFATHQSINNDLLVWIESSRSSDFKCPDYFYKQLQDVIYKRWEDILGKEIALIEFIDKNDVKKMKFKGMERRRFVIKLDK